MTRIRDETTLKRMGNPVKAFICGHPAYWNRKDIPPLVGVPEGGMPPKRPFMVDVPSIGTIWEAVVHPP